MVEFNVEVVIRNELELTLIDNLVKDLLIADPLITIKELYMHCNIIGIENGIPQNQIDKDFQNCQQLVQLNKEGNIKE